MAFVTEKHEKWLKFNHMEATIMEALDMLNELASNEIQTYFTDAITQVDESDPDLDLPNIVHAFQTAERIRQEHPDKEWFHLIGLIHDLGEHNGLPCVDINYNREDHGFLRGAAVGRGGRHFPSWLQTPAVNCVWGGELRKQPGYLRL